MKIKQESIQTSAAHDICMICIHMCLRFARAIAKNVQGIV